MERLNCILQGVGSLSGQLAGQKSISAGLIIPEIVDAQPYLGNYSFTPTNETQIIEIEGLKATQNITIDPIPQNYGLVTWDGSTLTVS